MTLDRVRDLPQRDSVLEQVRPLAIEAIECSNTLTWLPAAPLDEINDALLHEVGPESYKKFYAAHVSGCSSSQLFRPLMEAAARLFGTNPAGYLKWLGRAWQITTRNMGSVTTTEVNGGARVSYRDIPPGQCRDRLLLSSEGTIRGIVQDRGEKPVVVVDDSNFDRGHLTFDISW